VILLIFSIQNQDQHVKVEFFSWIFEEQPLILILYMAFCLGAIVAAFYAVFRELKLKSEIRRLKREVRNLNKDVASLRTIPGDESEISQQSL
jgi:uncharacterized integral membrane protein